MVSEVDLFLLSSLQDVSPVAIALDLDCIKELILVLQLESTVLNSCKKKHYKICKCPYPSKTKGAVEGEYIYM